MNIFEMFGLLFLTIALVVGSVCVWKLCTEIYFLDCWKWGDAHQLKQSVRLGWNIGTPPEGAKILVRKHAEGLLTNHDGCFDWAVMIRRGDKCYSLNGGLITPVTNITGWLEITEDVKTK